ncbi:MAG: glucose-6-phosphate isomerase family protein [Candidatus Methanospirareceae archaeon]
MEERLIFGEKEYYAEVRRLRDMKEVIFDDDFLKRADENMPLYYMYRDVARNEEEGKRIKEKGLRYDITVIPPNKLGREFVKTLGHYHPFVPHSNMTYAEIYEVLEGEAHYLLQKREIKGGEEKITDVVVVIAKEGDKVIIPPNYGHITINPSAKTLKMANFVSRSFSSVYEPIIRKGGGAYFELVTGEFVKNENYGDIPEIRFLEARSIEELGEGDMYELIKERARVLEFLINPVKFSRLFERFLR